MSSRKQASSNPASGVISQNGMNMFQKMLKVGTDGSKNLSKQQIEFTHKAFTEDMNHFQTVLQSVADTTVAFAQWSRLSTAKAHGFADITRSWRQIASETFIEMNRLFEDSLPASRMGTQGNNHRESKEVEERRVSAHVISFPDRRAELDEISYASKKRQA